MSCAVFTIVQNEPIFFPIWHKHYSKYFINTDIFVLHHVLPRPTTESQVARKLRWDGWLNQHHHEHRYNRIDLVHGSSFDHDWLLSQVMGQQRRLLANYDLVLFAEADEIVVPRQGGNLVEYLESRDQPVQFTTGWEVIQTESEPPLDWHSPLLRQRRCWARSSLYDKPLAARIPLTWCRGFHECAERKADPDPDLLLLHLHRIDWQVCVERNRANCDRVLKHDGGGVQNFLPETDLGIWWTLGLSLEDIPDGQKDLI